MPVSSTIQYQGHVDFDIRVRHYLAEEKTMRLIRAIFISVVSGLLAAVLGWFAGDLIGSLLETDGGLGTGLPTVWLMYVLAVAFGLLGFTICLVWQHKSQTPRHPARQLAKSPLHQLPLRLDLSLSKHAPPRSRLGSHRLHDGIRTGRWDQTQEP